jgi:hypothetical protein
MHGTTIKKLWVLVSTPALGNRHANRTFLRRIILSSVACLSLPYLSTLYHKRTDFRGEKILLALKKCFFFSNFYNRELSEILPMYIDLHVKYRLFSSDVNETWIFATYCQIIFVDHISWKSDQWEQSYPMQTGGQTWRSSYALFAVLRKALKTSCCLY